MAEHKKILMGAAARCRPASQPKPPPPRHRQGRHLRPAPRVRHQARVRQSRLDRTAVPQRLARRHRLRARPAGGLASSAWPTAMRRRPAMPASSICIPAPASAMRSAISTPPTATRRRWSSPPASRRARSCRCRPFSTPSAPRNFRGPMSNTASSRRAPKTCRRRSRAPITSRCSRPAGRPSSRSRSTTGRAPRSRSKPATSAANSAPIWKR